MAAVPAPGPAPGSGMLAAVAGSASPAAPLPLTPGLSLRYVPNPRYRPPMAVAPTLGLPAVGRVRALDHVRASVGRRGGGGASRLTLWELATGEELRGGGAVELTLTGSAGLGRQGLRTARLEGRWGSMTGVLGDAPPIVLPQLASLHGLRGGAIGSTGGPTGGSPRWRAFGGVPTPVPGRPTPRLAVGGIEGSELDHDIATFSFAAVGFGRGAPRPDPWAGRDADSLTGQGGAASLGWRVPLGGGALRGTVVTQLHDLDGPLTMAAAHRHELVLATRTFALSLLDERASGRTRRLGSDRFALAPRREDRWNLQARLFRGRAEAHLAGAVREGGDAELASRTVQLGGSGSLGASPWYGGIEATWDHREATGIEERRVVLHAGMVSDRGGAILGRIERASNGAGRDALAIAAESSWPLWRGVRLALLPRVGWDEGRLEHATAGARVTCPLGWAATRLTASVSTGATREEGFRNRLREAALAFSWSPRLRDRGDVEVRRSSEGPTPVWEYQAAYDARFERFESPSSGWVGARDSAMLEVRVVRAADRSPVADALVSLDGKDLRFTDADGRARFPRVAPGVHVVSLEERSLPEHARAVSESRVFVTIERGVEAPPVVFEVARPERRARF